MPKLVAILQSMAGRTPGKNAQLYNDTIQRLKEMNLAVRYTNYMDEWDTSTPVDTDEKVRHARLWYFAKLIEDISRCDAVVFNSDWGNTPEGTLLHAIVEALGVEELKMPEKPRYAMISQPMRNRTPAEISDERDNLEVLAREAGYEVRNTYFKDEWQDAKKLAEQGVVNIPLFFLAKSLEAMSKCHAVIFSPEWKNARGCRVEHEAATAYGLEIIKEVEAEEKKDSTEIVPYLGMKIVFARPQAKDGRPGYAVVYKDGYESWSPKDVFEAAYFKVHNPETVNLWAEGTENAKRLLTELCNTPEKYAQKEE